MTRSCGKWTEDERKRKREEKKKKKKEKTAPKKVVFHSHLIRKNVRRLLLPQLLPLDR